LFIWVDMTSDFQCWPYSNPLDSLGFFPSASSVTHSLILLRGGLKLVFRPLSPRPLSNRTCGCSREGGLQPVIGIWTEGLERGLILVCAFHPPHQGDASELLSATPHCTYCSSRFQHRPKFRILLLDKRASNSSHLLQCQIRAHTVY
jgi:hypothetical protein